MCNKGTAYNANSRECDPCESGNSVDGECVDYAGTLPIFSLRKLAHAIYRQRIFHHLKLKFSLEKFDMFLNFA